MGRYQSIVVGVLFPILGVWVVVAGARYIENHTGSYSKRPSYFASRMVCFGQIPSKGVSMPSEGRYGLESYDMKYRSDPFIVKAAGLSMTSVKWCEEAVP